MAGPANSEEKQAGRFTPGRSGNPAGKRKGSRNRVLMALDAIGAAGAQEALRAVVEAAGKGDITAAALLLYRVWPARKVRPVYLDLPATETAADLVRALGAVAGAVANGTLTPEEGQQLASVLEAQGRSIEVMELEARIAALEAGGLTE